MDDDGEYNDGDIVWVKLSYCWWPGEVMAGERLTEEFLSTLKRRPLAVVKFFEEDSYEFVKNTNFIYKYNCSRKHEFLRKGLEQYRAKNKHMEKFPADVMHAERATGGDPNIVNSNDFLPQKRESYADIFGKGKGSAGKSPSKKVVSPSKTIPVIPVKKHEVRILGQASTSTGLSIGSRSLSSSLASTSSLPSTPRSALNTSSQQNSSVDATVSSSLASPSQIYHCHKCGFESGRQNVIVLHTKYCRAIPMSMPPVKVAKPVPITPEKPEPDTSLRILESPNQLVASTPKTEIEEKIDKIVAEDELVEVIQVVEPVKPTRGGRTPRAVAATAKSTPKVDRRTKRGRGRAAPVPVETEDDQKVEVFMEVTEEKEEPVKAEEPEVEKEVEEKKAEESVDKDDSKDSKGKAELKNELLADWSEDEQDDSAKEDEAVKNDEPDKTSKTENVALNSLETSLEKSVDCSPQLASPVSSGTTIKYRNIPKKQKREFIEVTNDQPTATPVTSTVEKSSSESSISTTAATCGGDTTLSTSDKTPTSNDSFPERPISAKQRILDRATRGSSKSISSDETKQESPVKAVAQESQSATDDDSKNLTSCFDFQEDEEEEVVLNKSPRRSLSNRRDTSLELSSSVPDPAKEQEDQERAKKDAELKNKIESLLCETSLPSLPEIPKIPKAPSPGPSSSGEATPQLKDEIDRNRTLPPKERGKRIFKTRNKIIENEAIALEQSKAIVMDFVKKSHEEELAELLEQQRAEAKLSSESPTTTNDDSQESLVSSEPTRFENSEFAAIKSKRTKISQAESVLVFSAQEPSVSSTNETKATETESLPVSISKDQLALDSLTATATPRGRKGKQRKSTTPVIEKPIEATVEPEPHSHLEDTTPKSRRKRGAELQSSDLTVHEASSSGMAEVEKPAEETSEPVLESRVKDVIAKGRKKRVGELQSTEPIVHDTSNSVVLEAGESTEQPPAEMDVVPPVETVPLKGRKKRGGELQSLELSSVTKPHRIATVVIEKLIEETPEPEPPSHVVTDATPRSRKKRVCEVQSLELVTSETPETGTSKVEEPIDESPEAEAVSHIETPVLKGRKKRGVELQHLDLMAADTLRVVIERPVEVTPESELQPDVADASPKSRKKRGAEVRSPESTALDTSGSGASKAELFVEQLEAATHVEAPVLKGRKKRGVEVQSPESVAIDVSNVETPVEERAESEAVSHVEAPLPKGRKKRGVEIQGPESAAFDTSKADKPVEETLELVAAPRVETPVSKGRKKRGGEIVSPESTTLDASKVDKPVEETPELEVEVPVAKGRKKRGSEIQSSESAAIDTSESGASKTEKPAEELEVESHVEATLPVPSIEAPVPKGKKKRSGEILSTESAALDVSKADKPEETPELEAAPCVEAPVSKSRKKRGGEVQSFEPTALDTSESGSSKTEKIADELEVESHIEATAPKGRKKRGGEVQSPESSALDTSKAEKPVEDTPELEAETSIQAPVLKGRKKRSSELQNLDPVFHDTLRVVIEKHIEEQELTPEPQSQVADSTSKGRKKRGGEVHKVDEPVDDSAVLVTEKSIDEVPKQETDSHVSVDISPKGRKKRGDVQHSTEHAVPDTSGSAAPLNDQAVEEIKEPEQNDHVADSSHKGKKKRGSDRHSTEPVTPSGTSENTLLVEKVPEPEVSYVEAISPKEKQQESDKLQSVDVAAPDAAVVVEKQIEETPKPEAESRLEDATPKARRRRGGELDKLDLTALDTPRSRRGKPEVPVVAHEEPEKLKEAPNVSPPTSLEKHRKTKRAKKDDDAVEDHLEKPEHVDEISKAEIVSPAIVEESKEEPRATKSKRSKQLQQWSVDSTAEEIPIAHEPAVPTKEKIEAVAPEQPDSTPVIKQQPIKMIIKSRGRKSNSELLYEPSVVPQETKEDDVKERLPKSPKSSKRKKTPLEEPIEHVPTAVDMPPAEHTVELVSSIKSPKHKRPKFTEEPPKPTEEHKLTEETPPNSVSSGPTDTDLQIAEALIHLPHATPPKPIVPDQEMADSKPNSSLSVLSAKTINPRKRHLQTLMSSPELTTEQPKQPKPVETVTIPEKKKRETVAEVVAAPVSIVLNEPVAPMEKTDAPQMDEDKFDIDNIPIVMDDSELLDDSAISTTTASNQKLTEEETAQQIPATKPMTKKMAIAKSSNGSAKVVAPKEAREDPLVVPKKSLAIKSSTITIKPPAEQLSPKRTRSPPRSPPIRGAQLVQASSVGQIVITSKGTVFTTQSPTSSTAKSSRSGSPKTHVTPAKTGSIVSSVSSVSTISSSTSKSSPPAPAPTTSSHRRRASGGESTAKSPAKICVQSQEIIHPPTKSRSKPHDTSTPVSQKKTSSSSSSTSPPKKVLMKKHTDANASPSGSGSKPLFSTSKGDPITPQPATSSAVSPGKKAHKVIKISPQKLKEFTRLGMVEDKGQGKVLTASGMKKFRQEQHQLQKQQRSRPEEAKKLPRADSVDEEPSTSTPTPPPPSEAPAEVVVAAAADSSVKEIPSTPMEAEELTEVGLAASSTESIETATSVSDTAIQPEPSSTEENEADAAVKEPEAETDADHLESAEKEVPSPPVEALEPVESAQVAAAVEAIPEASESGSNVQESSQLIAVPAENFGGPSNLFYLCSVREEGFVPVNNELLYLDSSNQLVALPEHASVEDIVNQAEVLEIPAGSEQATMVTAAAVVDGEGAIEVGQQNILLNTQDGQQIILDQQSLMALAAGGDTSQLLTPDGQQILLQGSAQELLAALAVSQPGLGIVAAEGTQIIVAPESLIDLQDPPLPGEIIQVNPNTTVETNAVLTKPPIMSTVEVPTKNGTEASVSSPEQKSLEVAPSNLDESLAAVIGVPGNPNVPTSLELPITVTNPVIAKTTTSKINPIYPPTTAISAMALDPAAVAAAAGSVIGLPTVAQTERLTAIKSIWD